MKGMRLFSDEHNQLFVSCEVTLYFFQKNMVIESIINMSSSYSDRNEQLKVNSRKCVPVSDISPFKLNFK